MAADETTTPTWGFGCEPVQAKPLPASFVEFFPLRASAAEATPRDISWADTLAAPRPINRQPAWSRVGVQAHPATSRRGLIMKRVGLPTIPPPTVSQPEHEPSDATLESAEETTPPIRNVRPRLPSFQPSEQEVDITGNPPSDAEIASAIMRAKVDVTNCLLATGATQQVPWLRRPRANYARKMIPQKRRVEDASSVESDYANVGNRLWTYNQLGPILERAAETGVQEVDVRMASIAESSAILQHTRPDPRVKLAKYGEPDMSVIPDMSEMYETTEPGSPFALAKPRESSADTKSPTKKATPQPSPIKPTSGRLSDTMVRLIPASSPSRAEPSPTKSSAPSTPFKDSPSLSRTGGTPTMTRTPIAAQSPLQHRSTGVETPSSVRTQQSAVEDSELSMQQTPSMRDSPTKYVRPVAPTPSKWNPLEPSTPYQMFTSRASTPNDASTPTQAESSLGLVASIPRFLVSNMSPIKPVVMGSPAKIDFGTTSPSFTHASWLNSLVAASERERTKILRRRKSEPLLRNCLLAEARRKSVSPRKFPTTMSEDHRADSNSDAASPSPTGLRKANAPGAANTEMLTPGKPSASTVTMMEDSSTAAPAYAQYVQDMRASAADSPTPTPTPPSGRFSAESNGDKKQGIFDIDMRENPDIFGAQAGVVGPTTNAAIAQLAKMAEDRCNGDANVVVAQENGRLIVRFKLPASYAPMFPDTQCADESRFSVSPSAISSSPRLRFQSKHAPVEEEEESTVIVHKAADDEQLPSPSPSHSHSHSSPLRNGGDQTLLVSDFGSSPQKAADVSSAHMASSPVREEASQSSPGTPSRLCKDTTDISFPSIVVGGDDTTIPGFGSSPSPQVSKTPVRTDNSLSLSDFERTPSLDSVHPDAASTPAQVSNVDASRDDCTPMAPANDTPSVAPTPNRPTPVKQTPAGDQVSTPNPVVEANPNSSTASDDEDGSGSGAPTATQNGVSPGREHMRELMKRSKAKRPAATETGSPIAPPQRLPLGAKSPNAETPQKSKRKFEGDGEENESEMKTPEEPAPKRAHRVGRPPSRKTAAVENAEEEEAPATKSEVTVDTAESVDAQEGGEQPDKKQDEEQEDEDEEEQDDGHEEEQDDEQEEEQEEEPEDAPVARRSSRLRGKSGPGPKSSIPTPVRAGRGGGAAGAVLNSLRAERKELSEQTRRNTRKNKGNAELPKQFLAKCSEEAEEGVVEEEGEEGEEKGEEEDVAEQEDAELTKTRAGKSVGWKSPLAAFQEEVKAKRGRPPASSKTATKTATKIETRTETRTVGGRVAKPVPKATPATQRQRAVRATGKGTTPANGTPATRVTRSQARSNK